VLARPITDTTSPPTSSNRCAATAESGAPSSVVSPCHDDLTCCSRRSRRTDAHRAKCSKLARRCGSRLSFWVPADSASMSRFDFLRVRCRPVKTTLPLDERPARLVPCRPRALRAAAPSAPCSEAVRCDGTEEGRPLRPLRDLRGGDAHSPFQRSGYLGTDVCEKALAAGSMSLRRTPRCGANRACARARRADCDAVHVSSFARAEMSFVQHWANKNCVERPLKLARRGRARGAANVRGACGHASVPASFTSPRISSFDGAGGAPYRE